MPGVKVDFFSCTILCSFAVCGGVGRVGVWILYDHEGCAYFVSLLLVICFRGLRCGFCYLRLDFNWTWSVLSWCAYSLSLFVTVLVFIHRLCVEEKVRMIGESCIERRSVGLGDQRT